MKPVVARIEDLIKAHPDMDELKELLADVKRNSTNELMVEWMNNLPLPMWIHDKEYCILSVNEAAVQNYGYSREEFTTLSLYDLRPEEHREKLDAHLKKNRQDFSGSRWTHRRKDGSQFDVEIMSSRFPPAGEGARLILARDLTAQLTYERRMRELGAANTTGLVAAYVFHDVANLIMGGQLSLQALRKQLSEQQHQTLADRSLAAYAEARHILHAAIGKEERFSPKPVNINELIERSRYVLDTILRSENHAEYHVETELNARQRAYVDPLLFGRMTANLAKNACEAMSTGGVLRIVTGDDEEYVRISVQDTGKGMTDEERTNLFRHYHTTKMHGTGLGLPSVLEIVKLHQGRIEVDSKPGQGTRFDVYLPAA